MKRLLITAAAFALSATTTFAQTTPGDQFLQSWDLDGNGTATGRQRSPSCVKCVTTSFTLLTVMKTAR